MDTILMGYVRSGWIDFGWLVGFMTYQSLLGY